MYSFGGVAYCVGPNLELIKAAKYDRTQIRVDDKGRKWQFNEQTQRWRLADKQQPAGGASGGAVAGMQVVQDTPVAPKKERKPKASPAASGTAELKPKKRQAKDKGNAEPSSESNNVDAYMRSLITALEQISEMDREIRQQALSNPQKPKNPSTENWKKMFPGRHGTGNLSFDEYRKWMAFTQDRDPETHARRENWDRVNHRNDVGALVSVGKDAYPGWEKEYPDVAEIIAKKAKAPKVAPSASGDAELKPKKGRSPKAQKPPVEQPPISEREVTGGKVKPKGRKPKASPGVLRPKQVLR